MPFQKLINKILPGTREADENIGPQFGVIPYRLIDERVVFLMVTSRRSANWVFPKGSQIKNMTPQQTAAQEALEEAGVEGKVDDAPIGHYFNIANKSDALLEIKLFPMLVTKQHDNWQEEPQRFRHWALLPETKKLLANKQAATLAIALQRRILFSS